MNISNIAEYHEESSSLVLERECLAPTKPDLEWCETSSRIQQIHQVWRSLVPCPCWSNPDLYQGICHEVWWSIYLWNYWISLFYRNFIKPLGIKFGLKNVVRSKPHSNDLLEEEYLKSFKTKHNMESSSLSNQTNLTEKQIQAWMRRRKNFGKYFSIQYQEHGAPKNQN